MKLSIKRNAVPLGIKEPFDPDPDFDPELDTNTETDANELFP